MTDHQNRDLRATSGQLDQADRFAEALHIGAYCADPSPYHAGLVRALVEEVREAREMARQLADIHRHQDHDCDCPQEFCESEHADPDNCTACEPCNCCKQGDAIAAAFLAKVPR